jgi:hypothetical protein
MTLYHGQTLQQPLFARSYLTGPSSTSHEICDTPKKTLQGFHGHEGHRKPTLGATSTVRKKIDESKEIVLEIQNIYSTRGITFARRVFLTHSKLILKFRT